MDTSLIWNGAAWQWVPIDLSDYGYVEKEYYVSGRAKVYQAVPYSDYQTQVLRSGPYTTRITLCRPKHPLVTLLQDRAPAAALTSVLAARSAVLLTASRAASR